MNKFVFTCGDINGIGPEIAIKALNKICSRNRNSKFILVIPENVFKITSKIIQPEFEFKIDSDFRLIDKSIQQVFIFALKSANQSIGKPTALSGKIAFKTLKNSFDMFTEHQADAIVTAPVSKTALHLSGVKYPGQTEMFADWCGVKDFVMTFLSRNLRVGLYSIHIPLKKVSNSLNFIELKRKLEIILNMLKVDLRIEKPRIAILGLNPHSGENGIIGREELEIINPVIQSKAFRRFVQGPFSPDAFFATRKFKNYDLVFGLYHDQVLIPFKYINSGKGVNFSAGLPIIRTSPDHGVAYDIAGKGIADESSMVEAFNYAKMILKNRKKQNLSR